MKNLHRNILHWLLILWFAVGGSPAAAVVSEFCLQQECCCTASAQPTDLHHDRSASVDHNHKPAAAVRNGSSTPACGIVISCCRMETNKSLRDPVLVTSSRNLEKSNLIFVTLPTDRGNQVRLSYRFYLPPENKNPPGSLVPIYLQNLSLLC